MWNDPERVFVYFKHTLTKTNRLVTIPKVEACKVRSRDERRANSPRDGRDLSCASKASSDRLSSSAVLMRGFSGRVCVDGWKLHQHTHSHTQKLARRTNKKFVYIFNEKECAATVITEPRRAHDRRDASCREKQDATPSSWRVARVMLDELVSNML